MEKIPKRPGRNFFAFAAVNPFAEAHDTLVRVTPIVSGTPAFKEFISEERIASYLKERRLELTLGPLHVIRGRESIVVPRNHADEEERDECDDGRSQHAARSLANYRMRLGMLTEEEAEHYLVQRGERDPRMVHDQEGARLRVHLAPGEQRQFILSAPVIQDHKAYAVRVNHYIRVLDNEHRSLTDHERYIGGFNVLFVPKDEQEKQKPAAE